MDPQRTRLYLLGVGVTHSMAPPMHDFIASSYSLPWVFSNLECPTVRDMVSVLKDPTTAGAVITMPYKQSVIPHLARIDEHARLIGAVNNVYLDSESKLCGSNTDWEGISGCLRYVGVADAGRGKPAVVVGAGGASRAAIYALHKDFEARTIYIINRDDTEVAMLVRDVSIYADRELELIHVKSVNQASSLVAPYYVIGTVPDLEPKTENEVMMRRILETLMGMDKGWLLDMCFKPRSTRTMKLGEALGWQCIDGTNVVAHQVGAQWSLWRNEDVREKLQREEAWRILRDAADSSTAINF